jgi:proline dehydrogenase
MSNVSFQDTAIAFKYKTDSDLRRAYMLFKSLSYSWLVNSGPGLVKFAFGAGLPIKGIIKSTIFAQFCGGENIEDCTQTVNLLHQYHIGTILDYSVEGEESTKAFEETTEEILRTIEKAKGNKAIPFSVFKVTGIARFELLEKVSSGATLSPQEQIGLETTKNRIDRICGKAFEYGVKIFIDAEESWIQPAIDMIAEEMMARYNKRQAIVYNTAQLYRHDRLEYIKSLHQKATQEGWLMGMKLVRGAYMEKERARALQMNYPSPIQASKALSDADYNEALKYCISHLQNIYICAGTHNEDSSQLLVKLMEEYQIAPNDERIYFSQLLGMSDHISFNLSDAGYNVAKYVPYGPVKSVLPYLIRRAQENSSAKGQAGRELQLIEREQQRRKGSN